MTDTKWNVESLKEHLADLRANDKEALQIALAAADKAVNKAEEAQLRVNTTQNEFRGTLKDQAALMMPRKEVEQLVSGLQKDLATVQRLVWIGVGGVVVLQVLLRFLK